MIYSQQEVDNAMSKLIVSYNTICYNLAIRRNYMSNNGCTREEMFKRKIMIDCLRYWEQNFHGNSTAAYTNYITQADLGTVISWINKNC